MRLLIFRGCFYFILYIQILFLFLWLNLGLAGNRLFYCWLWMSLIRASRTSKITLYVLGVYLFFFLFFQIYFPVTSGWTMLFFFHRKLLLFLMWFGLSPFRIMLYLTPVHYEIQKRIKATKNYDLFKFCGTKKRKKKMLNLVEKKKLKLYHNILFLCRIKFKWCVC